MKFVDDEHKNFYEERCLETLKYRKLYSNHRAFFYTLGISHDTRKHYKEIYDIKKDRFNIEVLTSAWQTSGSMKVCRLAFNLLNGFCYECNEDIEQEKVSARYAVDDIFACGYAEYFIQAIMLRHPVYFV